MDDDMLKPASDCSGEVGSSGSPAGLLASTSDQVRVGRRARGSSAGAPMERVAPCENSVICVIFSLSLVTGMIDTRRGLPRLPRQILCTTL